VQKPYCDYTPLFLTCTKAEKVGFSYLRKGNFIKKIIVVSLILTILLYELCWMY